jgi:hypothetical protein
MLLQDCDEAIESYTRTRSAYYNLAPPSTYRTASQRIMDVISGTFKVTIGVLGWIASVPGKLWLLRKWSRDDWSGWYAGIKKTVKDEAHHYWVSSRCGLRGLGGRCLGPGAQRYVYNGMAVVASGHAAMSQ